MWRGAPGKPFFAVIIEPTIGGQVGSAGQAPLTVTLTLNVLNGSPTFTSQWSTPGGTNLGILDQWNQITRQYSTIGVYTASVLVTDASGNTAYAQITISAQGSGAVISGVFLLDTFPTLTENAGISQQGLAPGEAFHALAESITITQ